MNMLLPKLRIEVDTARLRRVGLSKTIWTPALSSREKSCLAATAGEDSGFLIESIIIAATNVPTASIATDSGPNSWYRAPARDGPATVAAEELASSLEFPSTRFFRVISVGR